MQVGNQKVERNEKETVILQRRALRATKNLLAGDDIKKEDFFPLRPCPNEAIQPYDLNNILGKELKNDIEIGVKINIQHMKADDWEADNTNISYDTESNTNNPGGYDAVNIYGDEYNKTGEIDSYPGMGTVHRTGYAESDLADYNTENYDTRFYDNVEIQFEDNKVKSNNFDLFIKDNIAKIYNNVQFDNIVSKLNADIINIDLLEGNINVDMFDKSNKVKLLKK